MKIGVLPLLFALAFAACGSSGGGDDDGLSNTDLGVHDLGGDPGADAVDDPGADAADVAFDVATDVPPDGPGPGDTEGEADATLDASPDQGPDDTTGPDADTTIELPFSEALIDSLCNDTCQLRVECHAEADVVACHAACVQEIVQNPGWATNLACWRTSESCDAEEACLGAPLPVDDRCTTVCAKAAECGLYPSEMFDAGEPECAVQCNGFAAIAVGTDLNATLDCIVAAVEVCDQLAAAACLPEQGEGPCTELCASVEACQNVPGLFESHEACLAACEGFDLGPALAAMACVSIGNDDGQSPAPETCAAQADCFPPPTEMAAGTGPFCSALLGLCAGQPNFEIPNDLTVCGWLLTGFVARIPGADFEAGAACVQGKPDCAEPNQVMMCLVPSYAPCTGFCQAADACIPEPKPDKWPGVEGCAQWCSMGHVQNPPVFEQAIQCVALSGDCETTMACLPNEP